jgi:hypothetical protein
LAFLHSLDKETSLITVDKNRHGANHAITIKADFEEARFEAVEAPWVGARNHQLQKLAEIIRDNPGSNQKEICTRAGWMKARVIGLLDQGLGTLWQMRRGPKNSKLFYPVGEGVELFCCSTTKKVEQQNNCSNTSTSHRTTENSTEKQTQQTNRSQEIQDFVDSKNLRTTENNSKTDGSTGSEVKISPFTNQPYPPRYAKYRWDDAPRERALDPPETMT